jgi:histidinol-phosphatase (PHP family)
MQMKYTNYHTHTLYCDGKDTPEAFVEEALRQEMTAIGFSSHSPLPFDNEYSIKESRLEEYVKEIRELKEKYKGQIKIYLALECDYVPGISDNFSLLTNKLSLDYIIGSVHLVKNKNTGELWFIDGPEINYTIGLTRIFQNDIKLAVKTYFDQVNEMILSQNPTIAGHFDKVKMNNKGRFFSEDEIWYKNLIEETIKCIKKTGSIVEVNTRGIYKNRSDSLYPGIFALKEIYKLKIPITISSDAHKPDELTSYFPETINILKDIGFNELQLFDGSNWNSAKI